MASITTSGIGGGLDLDSMISQIMRAETLAETTSLSKERTSLDIELSAYGSLINSLGTFKDKLPTTSLPDKVTDVLTATSQDTSYFTAAVTSDSSVGTFNINVVTLAKAHRMSSVSFTDEDTAIGTGTITIGVGSSSFTVTINGTNQTVKQIRDTINNDSGNTGVSASIINTDTGAQLVFTSNNTGTANAMTITVDDDDGNDTNALGLSRLVNANLTTDQAAVNAVIKVDGDTVTNASNTFTNAVKGTTITAVKVSDPTSYTLTIAADSSTAKGKITDYAKSFIAAYNTMIKVVRGLTGYDDVKRIQGALFGDATARTLQTSMMRVVLGDVDGLSGSYTSIGDIGISMARDGTLELDSTKLDTALSADFNTVVKIFKQDDDGLDDALTSMLSDYVEVNGILKKKTENINDKIDENVKSLGDVANKLLSEENSLRQRFGSLDAALAELNAIAGFLTSSNKSLTGVKAKIG